MLDGRRGATGDAYAPVSCSGDVVSFRTPAGATQRWQRLPTRDTDATFISAGTKLVGQLIEPAGPADPMRPLVVLVHGSERTMAVAAIYQRMLVAQGISVFAYQKRGTGDSEGEYTQNFELLADDAAAALAKARELAAGRFGRAGYFGGSQGGWIAPLAATLSRRISWRSVSAWWCHPSRRTASSWRRGTPHAAGCNGDEAGRPAFMTRPRS
jgi:dienelactone hydrolase